MFHWGVSCLFCSGFLMYFIMHFVPFNIETCYYNSEFLERWRMSHSLTKYSHWSVVIIIQSAPKFFCPVKCRNNEFFRLMFLGEDSRRKGMFCARLEAAVCKDSECFRYCISGCEQDPAYCEWGGLRSPLLCQSGFDELLCNGARRQQIAFISRRMTGYWSLTGTFFAGSCARAA